MLDAKSTLRVSCPSCQALLAADELSRGGMAICARCACHFLFAPLVANKTISRKAVASLVLAVGSLLFFCFTAIPAVILGAWALFDISRQGQRNTPVGKASGGWALFDIHPQQDGLRGRGLAVAGILLSIVCGFLSLIVWALLLPALQKLWN